MTLTLQGYSHMRGRGTIFVSGWGIYHVYESSVDCLGIKGIRPNLGTAAGPSYVVLFLDW